MSNGIEAGLKLVNDWLAVITSQRFTLPEPVFRAAVEAYLNTERRWVCVGEGNQCGPRSFLWRDETHDRCGWYARLLDPIKDTPE